MIKKIATALSALALTAGAQAYAGLPTNESVTVTAAGTGLLTFTLDGYGSLDGSNGYEDDFTVSSGSTVLFNGTFNLGGGGTTAIYTELAGTTIMDVAGSTANSDVTWNGGELTFSIPVSLGAGATDYTFTYTSVQGGFQGTGDEGWAVSNVAVVPEPGSLALMLAGIGIVGGLARRRGARQA
jgi:hypothetical protein